MDAFRYLAKESLLVSQLAEQLKTPGPELGGRITAIVAKLRDAERELTRMQSAQLASAAVDIARGAQNVAGVTYVSHQLPAGTSADGIRKLALDIRGQLPATQPGVVVASAVSNGRPAVVVAVNDAARQRGITAAALIGP